MVSVFATSPLPTGFLGNLTETQATALDELRARIVKSEYAGDLERDPAGDRLLLQFLRATMHDKTGARVFHVDAAEKRIVATFKWRREHQFEELRKEFENGGSGPEKIDLFWSLYPNFDVVNETTGQLVRFNRFGRFISTSDTSLLSLREWHLCFAWDSIILQHKLRELSKTHGREIPTYCVVTDLLGISMWGVASRLSFVKMMSAVASDHFPEMLGQTIAIRGPSILPTIFNLVKPFIDKDVQSKFVLSTEVPRDLIGNLVPLDIVPAEYGGTATTKVPLCLIDAQKAEKS